MTINQVAAGSSIIAGAAILTYFGLQFYQKKKRDIIPWKWEEIGTLKELYFYPLKSGHRVELSKADVTDLGIKQCEEDEKVLQLRDRCLVVYSSKDNEFRTARTYPQMLMIDIAVHDGNHLAIDAPTMRTLYIPIPQPDKTKETTITLHHGEKVTTIDCGDEAALWFSRYILQKDSGLRLGYHNVNSQRRDTSAVKKTVLDYYKNYTMFSTGLYSDQVSVSLISNPSVKDIQSKIPGATITANNFRPNLIVDGLGLKPYDEDNWEWVKIGDVVLRVVKDCTRCMMTTLNPENGIRNKNREPLATLEKYRMSNGPDKLPAMGLQMEVRKTGSLKVGEKVFISRKN